MWCVAGCWECKERAFEKRRKGEEGSDVAQKNGFECRRKWGGNWSEHFLKIWFQTRSMLGQNGTYTVAVKGYTYDKHCNIIPKTYRFPQRNRLCAFSSATFSSSPFFFSSSSFLFSPLALILPHLNTDRQKGEEKKRDPKPCIPIRGKRGEKVEFEMKGRNLSLASMWETWAFGTKVNKTGNDPKVWIKEAFFLCRI